MPDRFVVQKVGTLLLEEVLSLSSILKTHTDWYTAGKESLRVFRCVHMFIAEYTSIQRGDMDENQTVAGARSLKRFKC